MSSYKFFAATALMAALPSVFAGNAVINNHCNFPVFITHSENGADQAQKEYKTGESYNQPISGSAVCLKVMTQKGFCMTDNCVQLEYTSEPEHLWYDLSNINAGALSKFIDHGMTVNVTDPNAQQIDCPAGQAKCQNTYYQWFENENSFSAAPESTLVMNLCSTQASGNSDPLASLGKGASSIMGQVSSALAPSAASAPSSAMSSVAAQVSSVAPSVASAAPSVASAAAPAVSHAPVVPEVEHNAGSHGPEVIVTVTTTMMAREEATAAPEKRHIHAHAHHHRH